MKAVGIIPARMGSTRFPGKPMARICGMPMVGHCYYRTCLVEGLTSVHVATCDIVIADYMRGIGGSAILTSPSHTRATTRTAEALLQIEAVLNEECDVVVMVQGDEPLILPTTIGETLRHFDDPTVNIVNIMARLRTREQFADKNNVKVVVNQRSDAMYFSREPIPSPWKGVEGVPMYMQLGIIAFRRDALLHFNSMNETRLEQVESVDMNRVLESGGRVRMVPTDADSVGVDTPEELQSAELLMNDDPIIAKYLTR